MAKFLSCDWGTSSFRIRLVDAETKEISGEELTNEGIGETYQQWLSTGKPASARADFYKSIIAAAISEIGLKEAGTTPIIASGMISSSIGMTEIPYQHFPFTWDIAALDIKKIDSDKTFLHPLFIVSGFRNDDDVMRGEETLLLGADPGDDSEKIFIFPGTHSKHVFVKNRQAADFRTYMTGEVFNLLAEKSILRNAVVPGSDDSSFEEGFKSGMTDNLLHNIFKVRTRQLLRQLNPAGNYQYLSGLLIGAELADIRDKNCPVYIVSGDHLRQAYLQGLSLLPVKREVIFLNADEMLVSAHCKIAKRFL